MAENEIPLPPDKTGYDKKLGSYGSLILTTKRIIKNVKGFFGSDIKEIPLNKISSIAYSSKTDIKLLIFGIFLVIVGWYLSKSEYFKTFVGNWKAIVTIILGIGGIIILYTFLFQDKIMVFGSSSLRISQTTNKLGSKEFLEKVRKEIYK